MDNGINVLSHGFDGQVFKMSVYDGDGKALTPLQEQKDLFQETCKNQSNRLLLKSKISFRIITYPWTRIPSNRCVIGLIEPTTIKWFMIIRRANHHIYNACWAKRTSHTYTNLASGTTLRLTYPQAGKCVKVLHWSVLRTAALTELRAYGKTIVEMRKNTLPQKAGYDLEWLCYILVS